jgi:Mg/Co/Ni transporter MgtE
MVELMCNETFEDKDPNEAMEYLDLLAENARNGTLQALMRHQVKLNLIYLVEVCTTLGKIMTSKPSLHL